MLKFYLYSNRDLKYKPLHASRLAGIVVSLILTSSVLTALASDNGMDLFGWKIFRVDKMEHERSVLKSRLAAVNLKLNGYETNMDKLAKLDNGIRVAVDLRPIPAGERKVAVGGVAIDRDYGLPQNEDTLIAGAVDKMGIVDREARLEEQSLKAIRAKQKTDLVLFRHIPAIEPIRGGIITSPFGIRFHPILHVMLMHQGIDIGCDVGSHVHATGDGVVTYVGREGGYGNAIEIDNGFGYTTLFAHLSKFLVRVGEKVKRGQVIGLSGDTGLSTGPHLHYGVMKNGVFVNPESYFFFGREYETNRLYGPVASKK